MTVIPIVIGTLGTVTKGFVKGLEDLEIRGRVETNYRIIEIKQNTAKCPGVLSRFTVTQDSSGKLSAYVDAKNSQISKIIII